MPDDYVDSAWSTTTTSSCTGRSWLRFQIGGRDWQELGTRRDRHGERADARHYMDALGVARRPRRTWSRRRTARHLFVADGSRLFDVDAELFGDSVRRSPLATGPSTDVLTRIELRAARR